MQSVASGNRAAFLSRGGAHLRDNGMSYAEHMGVAFSSGSRMVTSGLACLLHGIFPAFFTTKASDTIRDLHAEMSARHASERSWALEWEI